MNPAITTEFDGTTWWARWSHPVIGPVDARGPTEQLAIATIAPLIREARVVHALQQPDIEHRRTVEVVV